MKIERINGFIGIWRFLSNFFPAEVEYEGIKYKTVEHAYQAAKTTDPVRRNQIRVLEDPRDAKKLGRIAEMRDDWEDVKVDIMRDLVSQKFKQAHFAELLLETRNAELVEGNYWHDTFWGKCVCAKHKGLGRNMLGTILMDIREELREEITK